jgi:hypothetical protein
MIRNSNLDGMVSTGKQRHGIVLTPSCLEDIHDLRIACPLQSAKQWPDTAQHTMPPVASQHHATSKNTCSKHLTGWLSGALCTLVTQPGQIKTSWPCCCSSVNGIVRRRPHINSKGSSTSQWYMHREAAPDCDAPTPCGEPSVSGSTTQLSDVATHEPGLANACTCLCNQAGAPLLLSTPCCEGSPLAKGP